MSQINRKKISISLSVSPSTLAKLNTLESTGKFGSVSDIVYISICELLGKIKVYEKEPGFDYGMLLALAEEDDLPKGKISISLSLYIDEELKHLSKAIGKSKSYLIRLAINDFVSGYSDAEPVNSLPPLKKNVIDFQIYRKELKEIMNELLAEMIRENEE